MRRAEGADGASQKQTRSRADFVGMRQWGGVVLCNQKCTESTSGIQQKRSEYQAKGRDVGHTERIALGTSTGMHVEQYNSVC
jgi:hypothetical protein